MAKGFRRVWSGTLMLLALGGLAVLAPAQTFKDNVVSIGYFKLNPAQTSAWLVVFKKHFVPPLEEFRGQGALLDWHLFTPAVHHPGNAWTHALVLVAKDRAAQGMLEKKFMEVQAALPPGDAKTLLGAIDLEKHFDDEWFEVNLDAVKVPEEKKEEKPE